MREEMAQPIRGAACGGTHRLSGLSLTVKKRLERGEPLDDEYAKAADFVKKYQQYAFRLQNPDGSLSTAWFRGPGDEDDINRRIKTTGHILEWLCYSLSEEELRDQRTVRAVTYLSNLMFSNYDKRVGNRPAQPRDSRVVALRSTRLPAVRQRRRGRVLSNTSACGQEQPTGHEQSLTGHSLASPARSSIRTRAADDSAISPYFGGSH